MTKVRRPFVQLLGKGRLGYKYRMTQLVLDILKISRVYSNNNSAGEMAYPAWVGLTR